MGLDTDILTHISVEIIYMSFKYFKAHRCALDFDIIFLGLLSKEKNNEKKTYLQFITHQAVNIW